MSPLQGHCLSSSTRNACLSRRWAVFFYENQRNYFGLFDGYACFVRSSRRALRGQLLFGSSTVQPSSSSHLCDSLLVLIGTCDAKGRVRGQSWFCSAMLLLRCSSVHVLFFGSHSAFVGDLSADTLLESNGRRDRLCELHGKSSSYPLGSHTR